MSNVINMSTVSKIATPCAAIAMGAMNGSMVSNSEGSMCNSETAAHRPGMVPDETNSKPSLVSNIPELKSNPSEVVSEEAEETKEPQTDSPWNDSFLTFNNEDVDFVSKEVIARNSEDELNGQIFSTFVSLGAEMAKHPSVQEIYKSKIGQLRIQDTTNERLDESEKVAKEITSNSKEQLCIQSENENLDESKNVVEELQSLQQKMAFLEMENETLKRSLDEKNACIDELSTQQHRRVDKALTTDYQIQHSTTQIPNSATPTATSIAASHEEDMKKMPYHQTNMEKVMFPDSTTGISIAVTVGCLLLFIVTCRQLRDNSSRDTRAKIDSCVSSSYSLISQCISKAMGR